MNNATILSTLNHVGYQPTGAVDGDTEREPTKQEREVQAWRDSGGKADDTEMPLTWDDTNREADGDWKSGRRRIAVRLRPRDGHSYLYWEEPSGEEPTPEISSGVVAPLGLDGLYRWVSWLHGGKKPTTPHAEHPVENASLPESGAIGQECGKVSDGPKPTGRARMCWESGGVSFHEDAWGGESDVMRRVERLQGNPDVPSVWIEYEYTATTPNAGNPVEPVYLPHTAVSGHGGGNSPGGAGLSGQAGEIVSMAEMLEVLESTFDYAIEAEERCRCYEKYPADGLGEVWTQYMEAMSKAEAMIAKLTTLVEERG